MLMMSSFPGASWVSCVDWGPLGRHELQHCLFVLASVVNFVRGRAAMLARLSNLVYGNALLRASH